MSNAQRKTYINSMENLINTAESEQRDFTEIEKSKFNNFEKMINNIDAEEATMKTNANTVKVTDPSMINTGKGSTYSLQRALAASAGKRILDGVELDQDQQMRAAQPSREVHGVLVPLTEILLNAKQRAALNAEIKASGAISGGVLNPLTGIDNKDELFSLIGDAIGAQVLSGRLGGRVITSDEQTVLIPRQTAKVTAGHVDIDTNLPASGDPAFTNQTLSPRLMGSVSQLNLSSMLARHPALGTSEYYASELRRALQAEMERVLILGNSGTNPEEPSGLDILATAASGAVTVGVNTIGEINIIDEELINYLQTDQTGAKWVLPLEFINECKTAASFSGSNQSIHDALNMNVGMVNQDALIAGLNLTKAAQVYTSFHGDFSTLVHCLFSGIDIAVNPYADSVFAAGGTLVRAFMLHDINVIDPKRILSFDTTVTA